MRKMLLAEKVIAEAQYIRQQRVHAHKQREGQGVSTLAFFRRLQKIWSVLDFTVS